MRLRPDRRGGFTLIEALASLVVTAALVALALPTVLNVIRHWSTGEPAIERADQWMQSTARLADDIAEALPRLVPHRDQPGLGFSMTAEDVSFLRPAIGSAAGLGLDRVTLHILHERGGDRLVRYAAAYTGDFPAEAPVGAQTTLIEGPFRLVFTSFGPDGKPLEAWHDPKIMPVRLELEITALTAMPAPPRPIALPIAARGRGAGQVASPPAAGQ
jgi:general secretion pathway protein J